MFANSNKAHDGYLGDSVIGEWCNLGAATSNSNVKNTAGIVSVWNEDTKTPIAVGQKCGVLVGDYTRTAINSSINTGSVYGICCNVFGAGLLPKQFANFSWGTADKYQIDKVIVDIDNWKKMKHQSLSEVEIQVLKKVYGL